jgi:hypothetical protein
MGQFSEPRSGGWTNDDGQRGLSPVVGLLLLFALGMLVLTAIQTSAVPAANERVEYEHSQRVLADMGDLDGAVAEVAGGGAGQAVDIELGTTYPTRPGLVNPGPVDGVARTPALGSVTLANAVADGEAGDYLNGSELAFDTVRFEYVPDYAEYRDAPTTVYEHGLLYNRFAGGTDLVTSETSLVRGRTVSLLSVTGDLVVATSGERTVRVTPVSAPAHPIAVTDDGDPLTLSLPTHLSNETWTAVLSEQYVSAGGYVAAQRYVPGVDGGPATLVLELVPGETYDLRMTRVAISERDAAGEPPRYVVDTAGTTATVDLGTTTDVGVVVRDRFNNPVRNAEVAVATPPRNGSVSVRGAPGATTVRTDADGRATFRYTAPANYTAPVETFDVAVPGVDGDAGVVSFTVRHRRPFSIRVVDGTVESTAPAARVTLLGTAITFGEGGDRVPVSIAVDVGDDPSFEPWPRNVNDAYMAGGGQRYYSVTNQADGTRIAVTATAYEDADRDDVIFAVSSAAERNTNPDLVDVFLAGDRKPDYEGFDDQSDAEAYLRDYVDEDGRITIAQNEAIFLFELGSDDPASGAYDFQDAVVLVTFLDEEAA